MNEPVVTPVLNLNEENESMKGSKKVLTVFAFLFFILAIAFFLYAVFFYGKPSAPVKVNTTKIDNTAVSAPLVTESNPIPTESTLVYTFPDAHGFNFSYNPSDWSVEAEPTGIASYNPNGTPEDNNKLVLASTKDSTVKLNFTFSKVSSGILNGNPNVKCSTVFKIVSESSSTGALDGLARITYEDGTVVYGRNFYMDTVDTSKLCIYTSHPFYVVEKVEGGDFGQVPDINDFYWIANISTTNKVEFDLADQLVDTVKFAE